MQDNTQSDNQEQKQVQIDPLGTMYLIQQLCSAYHLKYSHQLGAVCAHIFSHNPAQPLNQTWPSLTIAHAIFNRFSLVFLEKKFMNKIESHPYFSSFEDLVSYGMKCIAYALDQQMVQYLNERDEFKDRLRSISHRLISSLLLQYIPLQFSQMVLLAYLQDRSKMQQRQWVKHHNKRFNQLYPYHDLFQFMHMLSYHVISVKKVVNLNHYFQLMENPMMGIVQWPLIIGSRDMEDLPTIFNDEVQQ